MLCKCFDKCSEAGYTPELGCKMDSVTTPPYTPEILNDTKVRGCKKGRRGSPREKVAFLGLKTQFP